MNVLLPRETVSDDACRLVEIHAKKNQHVKPGGLLFTFESSKSVFDVVAEGEGVISWDTLIVDDFYPVGEPIATIESKDVGETSLGDMDSAPDPSTADQSRQIQSRRVSEYVSSGNSLPPNTRKLNFVGSRDLPPTPVSQPEPMLVSGKDHPEPDNQGLQIHVEMLRVQMRQRFQRHVPTGSLLNDRWQLAQDWGFGDGASCYDECLILGDVHVGENCWIGPFSVLDGAHAKLVIGDQTSIGTGTQIYTHDTIGRTLVGQHVGVHHAPTTIGNHCFIAPQVVIAPGTRMGDHCFVATGSYVQGVFPSHSYISGSPAKQVGTIEITDKGFHVHKINGSANPSAKHGTKA